MASTFPLLEFDLLLLFSHRKATAFPTILAGLLAGPLCVLFFAGCATVDPNLDFTQAATLFEERTGVGGVYDPAAEETIQDEVSTLLENGLHIEEAVHVALLNNRSLQAKFYDIGISRADVVQSRLLSNPILLLSARIPDNGGRINLTLGLAQELSDLWRIPIRKRIAEANLEQVILEVVQQAIELKAQTETAYYELLALHDKNAILLALLEEASKNAALAQRRLDAGEANLLDVNVAIAATLSIQTRVRETTRDERRQHATLARMLGIAVSGETWKITGVLPTTSVSPPSVTDLIVHAMRSRLDAQAMAFGVKSAEANVRKQFRNIIPHVALGLDAERPDQRALPSRMKRGLAAYTPPRSFITAPPAGLNGLLDSLPSFPTQRERRLEQQQIVDTLLGPSLEITLPLFDQNRAQIAKARFQATQKRKQYEALLESVSEDVYQSLTTLETSEALATFLRDRVLPLAQENVGVARRAYQAGIATILVLMDAQRNLLEQRLAYVDSLRAQNIAGVELRRAIGGSPIVSIETSVNP